MKRFTNILILFLTTTKLSCGSSKNKDNYFPLEIGYVSYQETLKAEA